MSEEIYTIEDTRPLVELLSVSFDWSSDVPVRGKTVRARVEGPYPGQVACDVEGDLYDLTLKAIPLRGVKAPLDAKLPFRLNFFLNGDDTVDANGNASICFKWNPQKMPYIDVGSYSIDHKDGYCLNGRAILNYSAIPRAVSINVGYIKFTCKPKPTAVYGDIFALHNQWRGTKRILFQSTAQNPITLNADGIIPLERSEFAVPVGSTPNILICLRHKSGSGANFEPTNAMLMIDNELDSKSVITVAEEDVQVTIHKVKHGLSGSNSSSSSSNIEELGSEIKTAK